MFIFPNIKVSHDQYIICTNNMAASNGTVGQTGNDFIISEQHLIMHCKFTNALYQTYLIAKHLTVIPAFVWTISSEQQH